MSSNANASAKAPAQSELKPFNFHYTKGGKKEAEKKEPEKEAEKKLDGQQKGKDLDEAEVLREVSSLKEQKASLVADVEHWEAKEHALQARITSYAELNKLIRRGAKASNAFTAAVVYLKKMEKALTDAENEVIIEQAAPQPK